MEIIEKWTEVYKDGWIYIYIERERGIDRRTDKMVL